MTDAVAPRSFIWYMVYRPEAVTGPIWEILFAEYPDLHSPRALIHNTINRKEIK